MVVFWERAIERSGTKMEGAASLTLSTVVQEAEAGLLASKHRGGSDSAAVDGAHPVTDTAGGGSSPAVAASFTVSDQNRSLH